jgi:hypothetical protein
MKQLCIVHRPSSGFVYYVAGNITLNKESESREQDVKNEVYIGKNI